MAVAQLKIRKLRHTSILTQTRIGANWTVLWKTVTRIETGKIIPWIALRNTVAVVFPLILGTMLGQLSAGLVMSTGALNVAFSDGKDPYRQRARRMLLTSSFCGLAVFAGMLTGRNNIAATLIAACWAAAAGIVVALGTTAADLGTVSLVVLVVFAAQPATPQKALQAGLLAFAGGVFQTLLSIVSWLLRPYEPERRALGQLYASLQQMVESHVDASESPPASSQSSEAQKALATLRSDYSLDGERYRSLLNQAERARLSIIAIKRLRARMRRESVPNLPQTLDRALEIAAHVFREIDRLLLREAVSLNGDAELHEALALSNSIGEDHALTAPAAMARDARSQLAALAGQLRSAAALAANTIGPGQRAFELQERKKPWTMRLTSSLAILRANLSLQSPAFRHALRLAFCVALGVGLGRGLGLYRPYWIPMTIALVLKPDFSSTFSRGVLRLAGTYAGLTLTTALFHALSPAVPLQILFLAAFTFLCRCFGPANYGLLTAAVSGLVVLLIALTGVPPQLVITARALNTTAGGIIALVVYLIWPTWEKTQIPEAMAALLDAYRSYFRALTQVYLGHAQPRESLDSCRLDGRLARSNMEASLDRYRAEPGASAELLDRWMSMLASSHRMVHAAMALEAELSANPSGAIPAGFARFFEDVDLTLELLATVLRNGRHENGFPDLREDHNRLFQSGGSSFDLMTTETDRITNSLNTLKEQVLALSADSKQPSAVG